MVFEGKKTEPLIMNNLKKYFLNEDDTEIIKVLYGTVIYKLYKDFFIDGILDENLDFFNLIKENIQDKNNNILKGITREQVSEIYLFFDYDGHATNARDDKIQHMLHLFDNETSNGKLYISYPMIEAIKHLKTGDDFKNVIVESNPSYKQLVSKNCNQELKDLSNLTEENWNFIIKEHSKKANFIVNNRFEFPNKIIEQIKIFENQKEKYINVNNKVAVLSAFPLFLLDYYGIARFEEV
jgi:hypothetical protein